MEKIFHNASDTNQTCMTHSQQQIHERNYYIVPILREVNNLHQLFDYYFFCGRQKICEKLLFSKMKKSLAQNFAFENYFYIMTHTLRRRIHRQPFCPSAIVQYLWSNYSHEKLIKEKM